MMRFKLAGVEYDAATVEDVTLRDTLLFEGQMRELGRPMTWPDLMAMMTRLAMIQDETARGAHPDAMWSLAVTVWASRRLAGEQVTVAQAAEFRISELEWLPDVEPGADVPADPTQGQTGDGLADPQ